MKIIFILSLTLFILCLSPALAQNQTDQNPDHVSANPSAGNGTKTKSSPLHILGILALGGLLGAVGQCLRIVVGVRKEAQSQPDKKRMAELLKYDKLIVGLIIGGVVGVLASINFIDSLIDKNLLLGLIAAGYSGTDFIEGFLNKYRP